MKRIHCLGILLLIATGCYGATTTVTGTIDDLTGQAVTLGQVTFELRPGLDTTISGSARFVPSTVACGINGSGQIQNLSLSGSCVVVQNTSLTPSGTYYLVCLWPNNSKTSCFNWYATASTFDITTAVPTPSTSPAYTFMDLLSNQSVAGNKTFIGSTIFAGLSTFSSLATFNQGFSANSFASSCANPANSGDFRLCYTGSLNFRNIDNSGNLNALSVINTNTVQVGDSLGITVKGPITYAGAQLTPWGLTTPQASGSNAGIEGDITCGDGGPSGGNGADCKITAGSAHAANGNGGSIRLTAGAKNGAGAKGSVVINTVAVSQSVVAGAGMQHARVTTGAIGGTTRLEVLLSWAVSFGDSSYTVSCSVEDSTTAANTQGLTIERLRTHSASQVGAVIDNPTGGNLTGTLDCIGMHD